MKLIPALFVSLCATVACCEAQQILNPDFEKVVDKTAPESWETTDGRPVIDSTLAKEGRNSLRVDGKGADDVAIASQTVKVDETGKKWKLRALARGLNIGAAYVTVEVFDEENRKVAAFQSGDSLTGNTFEEEWKPLEISGNFPRDAKTAKISLVARGGGTTWFDSVSFSKAGTASSINVKRPASLTVADFQKSVASVKPEAFPTQQDLVISDTTMNVQDGKLHVGEGQNFRTLQRYPEAAMEVRLAIPQVGQKEAGFGFSDGYRKKPRIMFVMRAYANHLRPTVEDAQGKVQTLANVLLDGQVHTYTVVREKDAAVFLVDGKEHGRIAIPSDQWPPLSAFVFNQDLETSLQIERVEVKTTPEDAANLKEFQSQKYPFREVAYREDTVLPALTAEQTAGGVIAFQRNILKHLFPNSIPQAQELVPALSAAATPGEAEPILLGLRATEPLKNVSVTVSDLKSADGQVLAASAVQVGVVAAIAKRHLYNATWTLNYSMMPMVIEPVSTFSLEKDEARGVWLDVRVPRDAVAGVYDGLVTVESSGGKRTIPLHVKVYGFTLESPKDMFFGAYSTALYRMGADDPQLEAFLREMRESGMTSLGYMGSDWAKFTEKDGQTAVKFAPFYERMMQLWGELGFMDAILNLTDASMDDANRRAQFGSKEYDRIYLANNKALYDEFTKRKWPVHYIQPIDEPSWVSEEKMQRNLHLLKLLKEQNLLKSEQDGPPDNYFVDVAGPYADMWVSNGQIPSEEIIRKAQSQGRKVLIYNTDVETWRPVIDQYSAGFFQWKFGLDGVMQWEYQRPVDLHVAYDETVGDDISGYFAYYYPKYGNRPGGPTIAWRAFREGIDDFRYIITLQKAIADAKSVVPELAKEIEGRLDKMKASLSDKRRIRSQGEWTEQGLDDEGTPFVAGSFNYDNGWTLDDYPKARASLASWITELQEATAKKVSAR